MQQQQQHSPYVNLTPAMQQGGGKHFWEYTYVVRKQFIWVVLVMIVCVLGAVAITRLQPNLYRASAAIAIEPPMAANASMVGMPNNMLNDEKYLTTQLDMLRTPDVIEAAVKGQKLFDRPEFEGMTENEIVQLVMSSVATNRRRGRYIIDVTVNGERPAILHHVANALVTEFKNRQRSDSQKFREDYKAELRMKVDNARSNINLLQSDKRALLDGAAFTEETFQAEYDRFKESRDRFVRQRDEVKLRLISDQEAFVAFADAMEKGEEGLAALAQHSVMVRHEGLIAMDYRIRRLLDRRDVLVTEGQGSGSAEVKALDDQLREVRNDHKYLTEQIVKQFVLDHRAREKELLELEQQIDAITAKIESIGDVKSQLDETKSRIARWVVDRDAAMRELEKVALLGQEEHDRVTIVQLASEPSEPYAPNRALNLTLGLVLGLVGGIALAFLRDYLDDTIRTKDELADIAPDVPLLGVVPSIDARRGDVVKKDRYAATFPKSTVSEAYRGVRTSLTLSARGAEQKVLLLTSAGPREGKTTTSINMATVLAYAGARTLIIDADLRKPRIHKSFAIENTRGLTNLIVSGGDPEEFCQRSDVEGVWVLPSGPIPPNPSELLGRKEMRGILAKLKETFDHVIIDTPPIGAVTDAAVLATAVDGVILVVQAGRTKRGIVQRGLQQLQYINAPVIGVILNNLKIGSGRYYPGYYHYYYYYSSHYGADERAVRKEGLPSPVPAVEKPAADERE